METQSLASGGASREHIRQVALLFLKLGFTAFGGPAAHIAMLREEVVQRRRWLSEGQFLDLVGITNLIPGPNSTEMAIHVGLKRAGVPGFLVAGLGFVLPATLIVLVCAWAYTRYAALPQMEAILYGMKPVLIAIIGQALWQLGRRAVKDKLTAGAGLAALVLVLLGVNEVALLFGGGLVFLFIKHSRQALTRLRSIHPAAVLLPLAGGSLEVAAAPFSLPLLFGIFFKIGAILYGSGYVLLAFLRADLVNRLGWLTEQQLLDAITIGQITPGPLFTSATFIGYLLADVPGALLATLGIFLPSFIFVALSQRLLNRWKDAAVTRSLLDGVNVISLALMAAVTLQLAQAAFADLFTVIAGLLALLALLRGRINSTWLLLAGALAGLAVTSLGG